LLELPIWQLTAGFLAATFVLTGAVALVRYSRPVMFVALGVTVGIPTIALATYAIDPGPTPEPGPVLWVAFVPAVAALGAGVWMLAFMSQRRAALTFDQMELLSNGTLVAFGGLVLALSDVVALWEPWFAVANVILNMAWAAIWIPRRWREIRISSAVDIGAPRARVYAFIADPMNWPRYQEMVVSVEVRPQGALAVGSEVVLRTRYEPHVRGPRMLPDVIETRSAVTRLEPESWIEMQIVNRPPSSATTEFADVDGGRTRISTNAYSLVPYRLAVFGVLVELRTQGPERAARARRNLERLKAILEDDPASNL
jgi:hypothetical protein